MNNLIDRFNLWRAERAARRLVRSRASFQSSLLRWPPAPPMPPVFAARSAAADERLRLATEIADDVSRADIESDCNFEQIRRFTWYDTSALTNEDPYTRFVVDRALRYLELRDRVVRHPVQKHLVRFER